MDPPFPSLSNQQEHPENPPVIPSPEQQGMFLPAVPPAFAYSGYPYGTQYPQPIVHSCILALVPIHPYSVFPAPYPHSQAYLQAQYFDATTNSGLGQNSETPGEYPSAAADSQKHDATLKSSAHEREPSNQSTLPPSSSIGSKSSPNPSVDLSSESSNLSATKGSDSPAQDVVPEVSLRPRSPPGLIRTNKHSFNDPRPFDTPLGIPQLHNVAYIPRKRPLIPDLLSIPRLTGRSDFKEWDELIQTLLIQMRLYGHIHSPKQKPHIFGISPSYPPAVRATSSKEEKQRSSDWWANDACVKMILSMRLSKSIMQMALAWEGGDTAREMYKLLWRMYGPPSSRREERLLGVEKREE